MSNLSVSGGFNNSWRCTLGDLFDGEIPNPAEDCNWTDFFENYKNYTAPIEHDPKAFTHSMHHTPRYGHSRDIARYVNGSAEEAAAYYSGIRALALTTWIVLIVWIMFLVYCRTVKLFGWLAGVPPERIQSTSTKDQTNSDQGAALRESLPTADSITLQQIIETSAGQHEEEKNEQNPAEHDTEQQDTHLTVSDENRITEREEEKEVMKWEKFLRSVRRCRIAVAFVTTMMLVFSGLTLGIAIPGLNILIGSVQQQDVPAVLNLTKVSNAATYSYLQSLREIEVSRIGIIDTLHKDCNLSSDDALYLLNNTLSNMSFPEKVIASLNRSLSDLTKNVESIDDTLSLVDGWWYWIMGALIVVLDIIAILFLIGTILAWRQEQPRWFGRTLRCLQPILCILLVACYVVATYSLLYSEMLSDLCINTPDLQVERILAVNFPFDSIVRWYIGGCHEDEYPAYLLKAWNLALNIVPTFQKAMNDFALQADPDICAPGSTWEASVGILNDRLDNVLALAFNFIDSLECAKFNPVYAHLAYATACSIGIQALAETFCYLFPFACLAMTMVTLRIAWWQDDTIRSQNAAAQNIVALETPRSSAVTAPFDSPQTVEEPLEGHTPTAAEEKIGSFHTAV